MHCINAQHCQRTKLIKNLAIKSNEAKEYYAIQVCARFWTGANQAIPTCSCCKGHGEACLRISSPLADLQVSIVQENNRYHSHITSEVYRFLLPD